MGYKNAGEQQELTIPVTLPPGDTQVLSLHPYLENVIPQGTHWASLEVNYTSRSSGLAAAMVSVSQDGAHSIRSVLNWVEANMREGWHWRADRDHNTLLGIYNADSEPAQVKVSLDYYSDGQRHSHDLPELTLPGRASELVDIGGIIASRMADEKGDTIPTTVTMGGYRVWKTGGTLGTTVSTEALVFDRRTKNFLTFYNTGCCYVLDSSSIDPQSITAYPGTQGSVVVLAYDECYGSVPVTNQSYLSSQDNSVVTVGPSGQFILQNPGSTTIDYSFDYMYSNLGQCFGFGNDTGSCSVNVKPTISGPNTVWYFGGQNPSNYATQITLTSSGGASTTWEVLAGTGKVALSTTTGSSTDVTSTGTAFSSSVGDIQIRAKVGNAQSDPFMLTSRVPHRLVAGPISTDCDGTWGFLTYINYTIQDQLLVNLPADVPLNENWTTGITNDYAGTNWRRGEPGSSDTAGAQFADQIGGEHVTLPPNPTPGCSGNSTPVQHWGQEWRIGSLSIGVGRRVQINTLQKYKDHASHTGIQSPAP